VVEVKANCGALALTICSRILCRDIPLQRAHEHLRDAKVSLGDLGRAARIFGLRARCCRLSLASLGALAPGRPAIAHLRPEHFVVVVRKPDGVLWLVDFPNAPREVSASDFHAQWTGYALLLSRPHEETLLLYWPVALIVGGGAMAIGGLAILLLNGRFRACARSAWLQAGRRERFCMRPEGQDVH